MAPLKRPIVGPTFINYGGPSVSPLDFDPLNKLTECSYDGIRICMPQLPTSVL